MTRSARDAEAVVLWAVSAVIAAVFFAAGMQKLIGIAPIGLEAAAMAGFPRWIRVAVGVVEVIGAILILIPRAASVAALGLAMLMVPATITQLLTGEPGVWIPIFLVGLLLLVAWRRDADTVRDSYRTLRGTPHPILREGAIAGVIGATVVALWFLGVDLYAGKPFFTPATLGRALLGILGPAPEGEGMLAQVAAYTVFHYAAFVAVGALASLVIHLARRDASILLGFVIVFVAVEVAFQAFVALLEQATNLRALAWYQVAAGNVLAAASMGFYLWRSHAELRSEFEHALDPEVLEELSDSPEEMYNAPLGTPTGGPGSSS